MNVERVEQTRISTGQKKKERKTTYEVKSGLKTSALKQVIMVSHCLADVTSRYIKI